MDYQDVTEKAIFCYPNNIADLYNNIIFCNKYKLVPSSITFGPTDLGLFINKKKIFITKREADVCKLYYRTNKSIMILHIENQTYYDSKMYKRIKEYHKLIIEELIRAGYISADTPVIFLTILITYSSSYKPRVDTGETPEQIIKMIEENKNADIIKEYRPKRDEIKFDSEVLDIFFKFIRLNTKKTEDKRNEFVYNNLKIINKHRDLSYYLKVATGLNEIKVPEKLKGDSIMNFVDYVDKKGYDRGRKDGIKEIIMNMKSKDIDIRTIAELVNIPLDEVERIIKGSE